MDDSPLTTLAYPDCDGLHDAAAIRFPIPGFYIGMQTAQTVGTVVAMVASCVLRGTEPTADLTGERVVTGVGFVVAFFKGFAFPVSTVIPLTKVNRQLLQ